MKKTLSVLAVLGIISFGVQSANAFCWSNLNPAYWRHCPKCQKVKSDCNCKKKCDPCENLTGAAANSNPCKCKEKKQPCQKIKKCNPCEVPPPSPKTCDPCDKLQNINK